MFWREKIPGVVCPNCGNRLIYKCYPEDSLDYYSCEDCHYTSGYRWDFPKLQIFEEMRNILTECRQILEKHGETQIVNEIGKILERENKHEQN